VKYYRRSWEQCRGDDYEHWGTSVWFFEIGDDLFPARQVEVYADGTVLRYDELHSDDAYGGLGDQPIDEADFESFRITASQFEDAWRMDALNRQ
jgi:hypothetical protein